MPRRYKRSETDFLKLKKHDNPETNTEKFDIENYLNGNWDKINENAKKVNTDILNINSKNKEQDTNIEQLQENTETSSNKIAELEKELKEAQEDFYQNSIRGQASGEYIHVEDSNGARGIIGISGNSEQETRSGKNKIDLAKCQVKTLNGVTSIYNKENNSITFNGTCTVDNTLFNIYIDNVNAIKNSTTLTAKLVSGTTTGFAYARCYDNDWKQNVQINLNELNTKSLIGKTYNDIADVFSHFDFKFNNGTVLNNFTVQLMLTDTVDTEYEMFGLMPSADYSSEVKIINNNIRFKICNKNIMPIITGTNWQYTERGIKNLKQNAGNTITSFFVKKGQTIKIGLKLFSKPGADTTFTCYFGGTNAQNAMDKFTHLETLNLNQLYERTYTATKAGTFYIILWGNANSDIFEFQLWAENNVLTNYEKYKEQIYIVPLQQAFKAIGNIRDTFIKINGKWYERHNINRKKIDGTENWELINNNSRFVTKITEQNAKIDVKDSNNNLTDCLSNRLINSTQLDIVKVTNGIAFSQWADTQYLYLSKIKDSIDELKKYLAENETYVDYPLETPIDIECTSEQSAVLEKLNNARTYKNITNLYSTNEVSAILSLDYAKDLETLLNNVQALALNNASEGV